MLQEKSKILFKKENEIKFNDYRQVNEEEMEEYIKKN